MLVKKILFWQNKFKEIEDSLKDPIQMDHSQKGIYECNKKFEKW